MDEKAYFGKIWIIEWLPDDEKRTGEMLRDFLRDMTPPPPIPVAFNRVETAADMLSHIRDITDEFRRTGELPLLHIEAHGLFDERRHSVGLCSDAADPLSWEELMAVLIPLNQLTGLRLFLVIAACEGLLGIKMAQVVERAAFLLLVGPNKSIYPSELARALRIFYRTMLVTKKGMPAIDAMNDSLAESPVEFRIVNSLQLFKLVYQSFLAVQCAPAAIDRRVAKIVRDGVAQFRVDNGFDMPPEAVDAIKAAAYAFLTDHERVFETFREKFFFLDLMPKNRERFPLTIADVQAPAAAT